jgi:hypothetical protein
VVLHHEGMRREHAAHPLALDPDPAAVDQPQLAVPALVGGPQVVTDDARDVAWRERMEVDPVLDRQRDELRRPGIGLVALAVALTGLVACARRRHPQDRGAEGEQDDAEHGEAPPGLGTNSLSQRPGEQRGDPEHHDLGRDVGAADLRIAQHAAGHGRSIDAPARPGSRIWDLGASVRPFPLPFPSPFPTSAFALGPRCDRAEGASCGVPSLAISGLDRILRRHATVEIAKGGSLGKRLQWTGAKRLRGRHERAGTGTEKDAGRG